MASSACRLPGLRLAAGTCVFSVLGATAGDWSDQLDQHGRYLYDAGVAKVLNLYEAKTRLSALVEEASAGAEIIIAKAGVPRARLVPLRQRALRRRPGGSEGRIWISPEFDAPLPRDILDAFEGKTDPPELWTLAKRGAKGR